MLVPEERYHMVDWRSCKLPRVARSSLSAEAQAASGASDAAEYLSRCVLKPTLVTDAKALYDA